MEEPEVRLKDPWLAALLAFLVPGLGHLYQRRLFKAGVYFVCILGLYAWGMSLSYGMIIQAPTKGEPRSKTFSFAAQAGVGLPALYAMYQAKRYNSGAGEWLSSLPPGEEFTAELTGMINVHEGEVDLQDEVAGTVTLASDFDSFGKPILIGQFVGQTAGGEPVKLQLGAGTQIGPVLGAKHERIVEAQVYDGPGNDARQIGRLQGAIPRGFWNWFEAPLNKEEEQQLHRELGKVHELAMVFTWIAGLLNLLAIWDALEGPAYGYGLSDELPEPAKSDPPEQAGQAVKAGPPVEAKATAKSS